MDENVSITHRDAVGGFVLITESEGSEQRIACGHKAWITGTAKLGGYPKQEVAASGAWTSESEYTAKLWLYSTPFCLTMRLQFKADEVLLDTEANVGFGSTKRPQRVGACEVSRPSGLEFVYTMRLLRNHSS